MAQESKTCQNCKKEFTIDQEDVVFYDKINVPAPTWCSQCRMIRRMVWMNYRTLYRRPCDACKKNGISMFPPTYAGTAYCSLCWWSGDFDAKKYARHYDSEQTFFDQWHELMLAVPQRNLIVTYPTLENSDYANHAASLKNCYLVIATDTNENSAYCTSINNSKDIIDSTFSMWCESCYECLDCTRCFKTFFSENCETCTDVWFSKNCIDCSDCIGCANLKHKRYCIFNTQYGKDEYEMRKRDLNLSSYQALQELRQKSRNFWKQHPNRCYHGTHNSDVSGDVISHSKNAHDCFRIIGGEDVRYCQIFNQESTKESYDYTIWGMGAELIYESVEIGDGAYNCRFCISSDTNLRDSQYCLNCFSSSNLFGCVGLRNAQYCILNKQYTKDEYEKCVSKIIEDMNAHPLIDTLGRIYRYGEFFPVQYSPYAYNETMAQEYLALTKEEAHANGYRWLESNKRTEPCSVISSLIPDSSADIPDSIVRVVFECEHRQSCNDQGTGALKITPLELRFYRAMQLPLPHLCPNCRHYKRIADSNPFVLWDRACMCRNIHHQHGGACLQTFKTSYPPERADIVYCEECYRIEMS
jgi:hypothetical protein